METLFRCLLVCHIYNTYTASIGNQLSAQPETELERAQRTGEYLNCRSTSLPLTEYGSRLAMRERMLL